MTVTIVQCTIGRTMKPALITFSRPEQHGCCPACFAVDGSQGIFYRGFSLPRGYFCSVTPP